jgi:hypothetical protein
VPPPEARYDLIQTPKVLKAAPAADAVDNEALRGQLLELLKQKAAMLDGEALKSAVSEAQQELHELHGARQLEEARKLLEQITREHPNTMAAEKAESILREWHSTSRYAIPPSNASPTSHNYQPI